MMQRRKRWDPLSMTGNQSVWTVAAKESLLWTRHGSGLMPEGAGLPGQDRRDNFRIVREDHEGADSGMIRDWHSVQGHCCSRSRTRTGQQLLRRVIPSFQPFSPILRIVLVYMVLRLHFPFRFPEKILCLLLLQNVRCCRHLIDQKSLRKNLVRKRIRSWYSPRLSAYSCQ
jgi:hypothetical protein